MKNLFSFVALMSLADLSAVAFQEMDYRYVSASGTTSWSTAAWEIYVGPNGSEKLIMRLLEYLSIQIPIR